MTLSEEQVTVHWVFNKHILILSRQTTAQKTREFLMPQCLVLPFIFLWFMQFFVACILCWLNIIMANNLSRAITNKNMCFMCVCRLQNIVFIGIVSTKWLMSRDRISRYRISPHTAGDDALGKCVSFPVNQTNPRQNVFITNISRKAFLIKPFQCESFQRYDAQSFVNTLHVIPTSTPLLRASIRMANRW